MVQTLLPDGDVIFQDGNAQHTGSWLEEHKYEVKHYPGQAIHTYYWAHEGRTWEQGVDFPLPASIKEFASVFVKEWNNIDI